MTDTNYRLMRESEMCDDDGMDYDDAYDEINKLNAEKFKEKYKEFYSDIKISIKEDW
ncbi:MAG: hypothetical protein RR054_04005 [Clostridia bacterium]